MKTGLSDHFILDYIKWIFLKNDWYNDQHRRLKNTVKKTKFHELENNLIKIDRLWKRLSAISIICRANKTVIMLDYQSLEN